RIWACHRVKRPCPYSSQAATKNFSWVFAHWFSRNGKVFGRCSGISYQATSEVATIHAMEPGEVRLIEPNAGSGKEISMFSRSILKTLLFATILLAAVASATAATPASDEAQS